MTNPNHKYIPESERVDDKHKARGIHRLLRRIRPARRRKHTDWVTLPPSGDDPEGTVRIVGVR